MVHYLFTYYLKQLLILCLPAVAGLYIAKNGSDNSKNIGRIGLIALATVLFIAWPVLTFYTFMGFAIGGGNPTFFQILMPALFVTSPLALAGFFSLLSARKLKSSLQN